MKKIILFLLATIIISCSNSDSNSDSTPAKNKIVGSWKKVASTIQEGSSGEPINNLGDCDTKPTYVFTERFAGAKEGNVIFTAYSYDSSLFTCRSESEQASTWSDLGTNTYDLGSLTSTVLFTNNDKTMIVSTFDADYIIKDTYSRQ